MTNTHEYIASIDYSDDRTEVVVWLTAEGQEALNIDGAYEINSRNGCANVKWTDIDFGDQHIECAPGGSEDERILEYMLENPESAISDIESRLESLREEEASEVTDIKREFIEGSAALTFNVAGEENLEWLDADDHNFLVNNLGDSHLMINGNFSDEIYDAIVKQLKEWLAENPIEDVEEAA